MTPIPRPTRLLLVEDDEDHADLICRALRERGFAGSVIRVPDGEAALSLLRRRPPFADVSRPDAVLLDIKLPGIDGHEVLRAIRADPALRALRVVMVSTSVATPDRARATAADGYLVKPIDPVQLDALLRNTAFAPREAA